MAGQVTHGERRRFNFGTLAQEYERWYETPAGQTHDLVQREDVRRLLRVGQAGERLLDVGCGTGHWSSFFAGMGYQVTGIDIELEMIEVARADLPTGSFQVADACELPFADASFDVVASMATLEFVPAPATAVREMARCAKSGGSRIVGTLNRLALLNRQRLSAGKEPYISAHLFSPNEVRSLLAPWGEVHMVASSPGERKTPRLLLGRLAGQLLTFLGWLRGPFIVAEVRR
jgi:ubiquinone/menaquinone biosynthesis C-methylase UbiE